MWKTPLKFSCPETLVMIFSSFSMNNGLIDEDELAPTLFSVLFAVMLLDVFIDYIRDISSSTK